MTTAIAKLKELGAVIVDPVELKIPPDLNALETEVFLFELKVALAAYLKTRDTKIRTLEDAIAFNTQHADRELRIFGQEFFEQAAKKAGLDDKGYTEARAKCLAGTREVIDAALAEHKLDAFVAATNGPAWLIDPI